MSESEGLSVNHESKPPAVSDRERRFNEAVAERKPLVTGKWGRIMASSSTGFRIVNNIVQGRLEGFSLGSEDGQTPKYPARENVHDANRREREFQQKKEEKDAAKEGRNPETITIDSVGGKPKFVVRDWKAKQEVDPDTQELVDILDITSSVNTYQGYRAMSGADAGEAERKLGMILGVAMGIVTSDGYIIIQKRGKNATYGDDTDDDKGRGIPGASAAGTLDAKIAPRSAIHERATRLAKPPGNIGIMIEPINTDFVTEGLYSEAKEEDGLDRDEIKIIPNLLIADDLNPHLEIGMTGRTTLKAADFIKRASDNQAIKRGKHDFSERILLLTPQELEAMLTEVEVPWPSTHALTMMGTLQQAYIQQGMPQEEAERKLFDVQEKWYANNRRINERIRHFYDEHPDALSTNRQKAANITDLGYEPRVFGKDQGIESLDTALRGVDIVPTAEVEFSAVEQTAINTYLEEYWGKMDPVTRLSDGVSSFLSEVGFHLETEKSDLWKGPIEDVKFARAINARDKMSTIVQGVISSIPEEFEEHKHQLAEVITQLESTFPSMPSDQVGKVSEVTQEEVVMRFDKLLKSLDLYSGEISKIWEGKIKKQTLERIWVDGRIDDMTKMALQLRINRRHTYSYRSLGEIESIVINMRELDQELKGEIDEPIFVSNNGKDYYYNGVGMTDGNGLKIVKLDENSPARSISFGRALTQQEIYKGVNNPISEEIGGERLVLPNDSLAIFNKGDQRSLVTVGHDELRNNIRINNTITSVAQVAWLFERAGMPIDEFLGIYYEGSDTAMIKQAVSDYRQRGTYLR